MFLLNKDEKLLRELKHLDSQVPSLFEFIKLIAFVLYEFLFVLFL